MHTGYVNGDIFERIIVNYVVFWVIGFKEYLYGLFLDSFNSSAGQCYLLCDLFCETTLWLSAIHKYVSSVAKPSEANNLESILSQNVGKNVMQTAKRTFSKR